MDSLIKYVPYNEVKIVENKNPMLFWSYYKVDIMKSQRQDFIHIDSDVFIFDDLLSPFINDDSCDMIIQNQIPENINYVNNYAEEYGDFLIEKDIIDPEVYDGRCYSCGVVGMRHKHKKGYIDVCEKMRKEFIKRGTTDKWYIGMANEELALYLYAIKNRFKFKVHNILPYEDVLIHTEKGAGNYHSYTHMYLDTKFQPKYVRLIRHKILKEFPEAIKYIERYENEVMKESELLEKIMV